LSLDLPAGARFTLELPGGGGYYAPTSRDPQAIATDLAEGLISRKAATHDY
jgi:N-methylhydantoinase B